MVLAARLIAIACILAVSAAECAAAFADARFNDVAVIVAPPAPAPSIRGDDGWFAWIVGDRGTILHSDDGGQTWQDQSPPTDVRLTGVSFINTHDGWAVGGRTRPHTLLSQGVVLATSDGGRTWRNLSAPNLPALEGVKFFDSAHGVAFGRASSMQASGVFITQDGGRTWQLAPGGRGWSWHAGDFVDAFTGSVAGRGLWAGVDRRTLQATDGEPPRIRAIHDLMLVPPTGGWAAGDGGLVLTTPDLGRTWFAPASPLPGFAARHFDLAAIAVQGDNVWAAGAPGSRVFHSPDAGRTWQSFATGLTTPLAAMHFTNARHGVAVGDLGIILTTNDGGRSWQTRRQGGSHTPLMVVAAREEAVPLEVLAAASADDGYLASVNVLLRPPLGDDATSPAPHALASASGDDVQSRLHEATRTAGGTSSNRAWRFPLSRTSTSQSLAEVLAELDRQTDGRTLELLESHLVRQIRMWRPAVVVIGASSNGPSPEDALAREVTFLSVAAAADPTRHVDLMTDSDLAAWQVKRVFAVDPAGSSAAVSIAGSSFVAHRGATIGQIAEEARSVLAPSADATPEAVSLVQLMPADAPARRLRTPFEGIELAPASDGRRAAIPLADADVQHAATAAKKRRNVQAILANQGGNAALVSHLETLTDGLDESSQARVLYELADGFRTAGQQHLAGEMLERLAREHANSDLVDAALVWLIQYHAASETSNHPSPPPRQWGRGPGGGGDENPAITLAHLAAELRPNLLLEPQVGVPLAAAYRRAGLPKEADRYMLLLRQRSADDAWRQLAHAERWLADPNEEPPTLPIWTCRRTLERPYLNGELDEPLWSSVRPAFLMANDQKNRLPGSPAVFADQSAMDARTEMQLAYDSEFLYLAIRAPAPSIGEGRGGGEGTTTQNPYKHPAPLPRRRDEHLTGADRIAFDVDLDRDLTTYYEFTVDEAGRAYEAAWHDARWNPKWYIAHGTSETGWTIEAAIPLAELAAAPPEPRDVWCIAARRIDADGRVIPWHGPATAEPSAASFGLLIFE